MTTLKSLLGAAAMSVLAAAAGQAQTLTQQQVATFAEHDPQSQLSVDYDAFTMILGHIIFQCGTQRPAH